MTERKMAKQEDMDVPYEDHELLSPQNAHRKAIIGIGEYPDELI